MSTLKDILHLEGDNTVEVVLGPDGEKQYEEVKKLLQEKFEPFLKEYLTGLKLREKLQEVNSIDDLEKVTIEYVPQSFKELLADTIDTLTQFSSAQKVWLFAVYLNSFYQGAAAYANAYFQGRAQQLANQSRIIKP